MFNITELIKVIRKLMFKLLSRLKQKLIRLGILRPGKRQSVVKYTAKNAASFHADHININHFSGWVIGEQLGGVHKPANIQVFRGETVVGEKIADLARIDVSSSGKGPLNCGFQFKLYWRHFDEGHNKCRVLINGQHVADILLYVTIKDLLVGQADELAKVLLKL